MKYHKSGTYTTFLFHFGRLYDYEPLQVVPQLPKAA